MAAFPIRSVRFDTFAETNSVIRRYAPTALGLAPATVDSISTREGAAIIGGHEHDGVRLLFLDLSSLSSTGTFKDWVACITVAHCIESNCHAFITQSSGNTANALAYCAPRAGIEVCILYPAESRYKINSALARQEGVTFVEVLGGEPMVKLCAEALENATGLPWLPTLGLQKAGNGLRADFLHEYLGTRGEAVDWHVQALSSAFGPLGFYDRLDVLRRRGEWPWDVPKFLGVQQEAVSPYYDQLHGLNRRSKEGAELLEPTLFRSNPSDTLIAGVKQICESSRGRVTLLRNDDYLSRRADALRLLEAAGLHATRRIYPDGRIRLLEEAGIMAVVAVLREIEAGTLLPGETVLIALTGGFFPRVDAFFEPDQSIGFGAWRRELERLGRRVASGRLAR